MLSSGVALLRSQWRQIVLPMPERYDIQSSGVNLRLVVQRKMRDNYSAVRAKRTAVQVYSTDYAQVSRGLYRPGGRSILGAQV